MSIQVGDVLRVVASMALSDGEINQNVYNAVIGGTGGPFDEADIVADALAWVQNMYANMTALVTPTLGGSEVIVYLYDSVDNDWDEVGSTAWSWTPTGTGNPLPRGVAGLVNATTLDPDVQGKKYLPGGLDSKLSAGVWGAPYLAALAAFALDWVVGFTGGTSGASWVPAVWSVAKLTAHALGGSVTIPVIPAYQRRRKNLVGI